MSRRTNLFVLALCCGMLLGLAHPQRASAATFSGTITTPQSALNDVIALVNVTTTASGTITGNNTDGAWYAYPIQLYGTNDISGDITALMYTVPAVPVPFPGFVQNYGVTTQNGGTVYGGFGFTNYAGTVYNLANGTLSAGTWTAIATSSTFTQTGGTILGEGASVGGTGGIDVGGSAGTASGAGVATMNLNGGAVNTSNFFVGRLPGYNSGTNSFVANGYRSAVVQQSGSTVLINGSQGWFYDVNPSGIGGSMSGTGNVFEISQPGESAESSYTLKGGSLSIPNGDTRIHPWGKFGGYGTVTSTGRTLKNSGMVVADGFGSDANMLNLTSYGTVTNPVENGTERNSAGWYAQNHGKLTLPSLNVSAGSSTVTWGEDSADATIDLINSVRLSFTGASAGTFSASLLASDRADMLAGLKNPVGVWDFTGPGFSTVDLTFRYDDLLAGANEGNLKLFHRIGDDWVLVPSSLDQANNLLAATGVTSFSEFAIATGVPEPATLSLLALAPLMMLRRKR